MIVDWFAPLATGVFGLLFGSFANVVIWRLPRKESLSSPPSHCPECDAPIAWRDNIPVVSWVALRGRCRSCGTKISPRYPAVEILSAGLWVLMWFVFGTTVALIFAIAFAYLLLILSFIDLDVMRLPNPLVGLLAGIGLVGVVISQTTGVHAVPLLASTGKLSEPWAFASVGLLIGFVLPLIISSFYSVVRGGSGIGMGDVKLLGAMGLYLGPYILLALMLGSIIGTLVGIFLRGPGGLRRKVPFGPFLAIGAIATLVVGPTLWAWYSAFL